jgi:hypothetical protein
MNITPEEQQALVQFFGTVHAQARQTDQMIVGNSQFVRPVSPIIQHQLEEALRIPVQNNIPNNNYTPPAALPPVEQPVVQPVVVQPPPEAPVQHLPLTSDVKILGNNETVEVLKEISLNLARIANILEKKNGTPKRTKPSKPA